MIKMYVSHHINTVFPYLRQTTHKSHKQNMMFCSILPFQCMVVIMHMLELYRRKSLGARVMGCTATMW